jgi:hypothetical protein
MLAHAEILALILLGWACLAIMHVGCGVWLRRAAGLACDDADALFDAFFAGWALTIAFLQIWNLFFRVGGGLFWVLLAAGALGAFLQRAPIGRVLRRSWPASSRDERALVWLGFSLLVVVLACWAAKTSADYDYGLYHTTTVRWAIEYPVVPGIGNLYARVSHNCASFRYVALIEDSFLAGRAPHFASSILLLAVTWRIFVAIGRLRARTQHWPLELYWIAVFPIACVLERDAGSIAPDVSVAIAMIVIMAVAVRLTLMQPPGARERDALIVYTALLAGVGLSIKLSFGPFGIVALGLLGVRWFRERSPGRWRVIAIAVGVSVLAIVPWSIHSAIMTGYPLYPSPLFPLPVDWRVPRASVINVRNWIHCWGRHPGQSWVIGFLDWSWAPALVRRIGKQLLGEPLAYASAAVSIAVVAAISTCARQPLARVAHVLRGAAGACLLLLPVLAYDVFWLIAAPTLRFNRIGFVLPAALALVLATFGLRAAGVLGSVARGASIGFVAWRSIKELTLVAAILGDFPLNQPWSWYREAAIQGDVAHETYFTQHGVAINYRSHDEHFTGVPLPVSPHYEFCRYLAYREPGNLAAGFKVTPFYEGMITGFHGSAWPRPGFDPAPPAFWGFSSASGLGADEKITASDGGVQIVRRASGPETRLRFDAHGGRHVLFMRGSNAQPLTLSGVRLNGRTIDVHRYLEGDTNMLAFPLDTQRGENEVVLAYPMPQTAHVAYQFLQIWPPRAGGDEWWWGLYAEAGE